MVAIRAFGTRLPRLAKSEARERAVAYFAGRQAAERNEAASVCPYQDDTGKRVWLLGWHSEASGKGERRTPLRRSPVARRA